MICDKHPNQRKAEKLATKVSALLEGSMQDEFDFHARPYGDDMTEPFIGFAIEGPTSTMPVHLQGSPTEVAQAVRLILGGVIKTEY